MRYYEGSEVVKNALIEKPNNPRDVLVWVLMTGWMMGNYENGLWRLYFSDTELQVTKNQDHVVRWQELPDKPTGIVNPDWYHGKF